MIENCIGVDFFCGCGGMTAGLKRAGVDVRLGIDNNPKCRKTYEENNNVPFEHGDIRSITRYKISKMIDKRGRRPLIFAGCAPCQPFSKVRKSGIKDHPDSDLLKYFFRFVLYFKPKFVLCENVPQLLKSQEGYQMVRGFLNDLRKNGYATDMAVVNTADFNVPQNRWRLIILASKTNGKVKVPDGPTRLMRPTVRQAIKSLPSIKAGERSSDIPNHWASALSPINLKRIRATPKNGGDLRSLPKKLRPPSRKNLHKYGKGGFFDVYGRMHWDKPSPTLTTRCNSFSNGRYGHPKQNRAISLREAARLQSFRDSYIFYIDSIAEGAKMIGNAVPVNMVYHLTRALLENHSSP